MKTSKLQRLSRWYGKKISRMVCIAYYASNFSQSTKNGTFSLYVLSETDEAPSVSQSFFSFLELCKWIKNHKNL